MKKDTLLLIALIVIITIIVGIWHNRTSKTVETPDSGPNLNVIENEFTEQGLGFTEVNTVILEPVDGQPTGTSTVNRTYNNQSFTYAITADLNDPPTGKIYEGWLVAEGENPEFYSIGNLTKSSTVYTLNYTEDRDLLRYKTVIITEETEQDGPGDSPETRILEGSFE